MPGMRRGLLAFPLLASCALAVCPVCTVAVGSGVGLARWLGIDDSITGAWIGGLIVSVSAWMMSWMKKKNIGFAPRVAIIPSLYLATVLPLYAMGIVNECGDLFGMNKLLLGIVCGSLAFTGGDLTHRWLKGRGKNFAFQKVVLPILFLVVLSIIFYGITG